MDSKPARPLAGWARALIVIGAVVALDQLTKALVRAGLQRGERRDLVLGIDLVHVRNRGIAFGLFIEHGPLLTVLTFAALGLLVAYFAVHPGRPLLWLATGMMLGGAIGNLIDRVRFGAVTDFIDLPWWPAFNLADTAITLGVLTLLMSIERRPEEPG
jgi:signal peptidase II